MNKLRSKSVIEKHPKQEEIAKDTTRFKVVVTGRRWGKSVLGGEIALNEIFKKKNALVWIVAPTREMAKEIHWEYLKKRVKELHWKVKINESSLSIRRLMNGSQLVLKTADNPDRLRGRGLDLIIIDEFRDMKSDVWDKVLRPTLTDKQGSAIFTSTPNGHDTLFDLYKKQETESNWKSWHYRTIESPFISADEIEQARKDLDERTFLQEYEASFDTGGNSPYYSYNYLNNNSEFRITNRLPLIVACDFNATEKPMSWVMGQRLIIGTQDITYWLKSFAYPFTNTETMCGILWDYLQKIDRPKEIIFYGDYAGKQVKSNSSQTDWQIIEKYFSNKFTFSKKIRPCLSIRDSIGSTNAQLCNTLGERRQFINPEECKPLLTDWLKCEWKENGKELSEKNVLLGHSCRAVDYYNYYEHPIRGKIKTTITHN